ncbi:glycosyltransferase family 87 protein [Sphingomonas sp. CFBP8993]|nr:glycosyltransferase family 87 protein [Sphingomonas sp. CFBP8993]
MLFVSTASICGLGWILLGRDGVDPMGKPFGTDFLAFWSAARLALAGVPEAAWDLARIGAMERASVVVDPGLSSFLYPPPFLLVCLPFGMLPYCGGLAAWLALTGGLYLAAIRRWLVPHHGVLMTVTAFPAVIVNIGHGQNGFLTGALLASGLGLAGRRPWLAGMLLGTMIVKPQLALALPIFVIAGGHWRVMGGALASMGLWCLASMVVLGQESWVAFFHAAPVGQAILDQGLVDPAKMVSLYAAMRVLHSPGWLAFVVQLTGATGAALMLVFVTRAPGVSREAAGALTAAVTLLMSPFLLDYDLTLAAIPIAWLFSQGVRRGFRPWDKLVLAACFALPLVGRSIAMATGVPVAPVILWALAIQVARAALRTHGDAGRPNCG